MHYLLVSQLSRNEPRRGLCVLAINFIYGFFLVPLFLSFKEKFRIIEWVISKLKELEIFIKIIVQVFLKKIKIKNQNYNTGYFKTQTNNRQFSLKELAKNHRIKELL